MDALLGALFVEYGKAIFIGFVCLMGLVVATILCLYRVRSADRRKFAGPRPRLYRIGDDWSDD